MKEEIERLYEKARELLHLGDKDGFVYADDLSRLNKEVHELIHLLWNKKPGSIEEEARLCLAILMGFNGIMYANPEDEKIRCSVTDRTCYVLKELSSSLLKCQLLIYYYGEVEDDKLIKEAKEIMKGWERRELSAEELETVETLEMICPQPTV